MFSLRSMAPPDVSLSPAEDPSVESRKYRLRPEEPVGEGLRRVIAGRIESALEQLRGEGATEPADAVHEARKDLKKARSALRLGRDLIGDEVFKAENARLGDVGRRLSSVRDAEVMLEALDSLSARFDLAEAHSGPLRTRLEQARDADAAGEPLAEAIAGASAILEPARAAIASLPMEAEDWTVLEPGLHRTYRRGRRRMAGAQEDPTVENLHAWRKRAKDLWYQLRLVKAAQPRLMAVLAEEAHDLSTHLGDDHDLALLRTEVASHRDVFETAADQRLIETLIDQRRGELQFASYSIGSRLYDRKPKKFVRMLKLRSLS